MDPARQEEEKEGRKEKSFLTFSAFYEIMYIETMAEGANMSRKDFQLIADVLKASSTSSENCRVIKELAVSFANELIKTNPRFNTKRFVEACLEK
jgi:hypothetical protein